MNENMAREEQLLTVEQVAERLKVSLASVRRYINEGIEGKKLKAVKIGRMYRVKLADLDLFINGKAA